MLCKTTLFPGLFHSSVKEVAVRDRLNRVRLFLSVEQKSRTVGATSFPVFSNPQPKGSKGSLLGWGDDGGGTSDQECYNCHSVVPISTCIRWGHYETDSHFRTVIEGKNCIAVIFQGTTVSVLWPPLCFHLFRLMKSSCRPHTLK